MNKTHGVLKKEPSVTGKHVIVVVIHFLCQLTKLKGKHERNL